ncbi:hypothetical protein F1737_08975 [Methanoplanus sp. FWC-SCC4]|uniref:Uncharacterized protein n=1 Tax=Methanochimaera problematica TaxID=2609417 RepID=A0AA97FDD9_9EURY|nr:hypothetical protein [Methanoplanus sp. FWC-SCC4]WOF16812.1 hypothetical protein F1737_08975 [Methanoplanus sp. FWC-SCC4]
MMKKVDLILLITAIAAIIALLFGLPSIISLITDSGCDDEICHDAWKVGYIDGRFSLPPHDDVLPKFQTCYDDGYLEGLNNPYEDDNISQEDNS